VIEGRGGADRGRSDGMPSVSSLPFGRGAGAAYGVAAEWSGWGEAGEVGARRQCEVGEEGAHDRRILDGGDDTHPAATAWTGEDVEIEHVAHEGGPDGAGGLTAYEVRQAVSVTAAADSLEEWPRCSEDDGVKKGVSGVTRLL